MSDQRLDGERVCRCPALSELFCVWSMSWPQKIQDSVSALTVAIRDEADGAGASRPLGVLRSSAFPQDAGVPLWSSESPESRFFFFLLL